MSTYRTFQMLDLSTVHLPLDVRSELHTIPGVTVNALSNGGWLLCVPGETELHITACEPALPPAVAAIWRFAAAQGCEYVLFDRDGAVVDVLDRFEEDNEDQDEAENVCQNVEHLYEIGRTGSIAALEFAVRDYVTNQDAEGCPPGFDVDNVDFGALRHFLRA